MKYFFIFHNLCYTNKKREKLKNKGKFLIFKIKNLIISFLFIVTLSSLTAQENTTTKKVKIGYFENEIFQEGAAPNQIKKGYAYEYYRKISEYTGWEYEYIYGNFSELYKSLEEGKIDLLAGLAYTDERAKKISYANSPMGSTRYYLIKKSTSFDITSNPSSLNNKTIGVQNSVMVQVLNNWITQNKIKANVRVYEELSDLFESFEKGELDSVLIEGSGTYDRKDVSAFLCVGSTDFYFCVPKTRPDILNSLNSALYQIISDNPNFSYNLYNKYFGKTITGTTFTEGEIEYIKNHDSITIGYLNNYLPYCDTDSKGNLTGFLKDIIPEQISKLGLSDKIKIHYQKFESSAEMIKSLNEQKIDLAFPVGGGLYFSEKSGFYESQPVIKSSVAVVYNGIYEKNHKPVFAINQNNEMQRYYAETNFPDAEIKLYNSINECLNAIKKHEADYTTINGLRVNAILKNTEFKNLNYRLLYMSDERCFGIKIGNEHLLQLINRGLNLLGDQYILNLAYQYTEQLFKYTTADYIRNILLILIPIILIAGIIIILYELKTRLKLKALNQKLKAALENKEKIITDMIRYASSEDDASKILNQLVEYIGKNTISDRVYVFEENSNHNYDNTYEWCNKGITKEIQNLQDVPYESVEVWIKEFKKNGQVTVKNLEAYKSISEEVYEILKPQNINTLAAVPLEINGKIIGFIGIDNPPEKDINTVAEFLKLIEFFFTLMIRIRNGMNELQYSAVHDQLTGCKNRKALSWVYKDNFNEAQSVSVLAIDLNGLKQINDNNGHDAGDKFICRTADTMLDIFGSENVYRMGGDEFIVVLIGKTTAEFDSLMNTFSVMTGTTASCGYVHQENCTKSFDELLKEADFKMYKAKDEFYQDKRRRS